MSKRQADRDDDEVDADEEFARLSAALASDTPLAPHEPIVRRILDPVTNRIAVFTA